MKISIIIPVYKNNELFMKMLEHNYPFIKQHEIIIVDDYSQNNLKTSIEKAYKNIIVIENEINKGFSKSVNSGIKHATGDIVFLLNSDVKLLDNTFEQAVKRFVDEPKLFAVSFLQIEKNGNHVGKNVLFFSRGFMMHRAARNMASGITAWAEGGSALFRKKMLFELNLLDPLYSPFYWEDIDLSYRAYKRGWHVLFDATVKVEHHHESTIKKYYQEQKIKQIAYRNQLIFLWKNISDWELLIQHFLWLPVNLVWYTLFHNEPEFMLGFFLALKSVPKIILTRLAHKQNIRTDSSILNKYINV